jgi:hypothetical protein
MRKNVNEQPKKKKRRKTTGKRWSGCQVQRKKKEGDKSTESRGYACTMIMLIFGGCICGDKKKEKGGGKGFFWFVIRERKREVEEGNLRSNGTKKGESRGDQMRSKESEPISDQFPSREGECVEVWMGSSATDQSSESLAKEVSTGSSKGLLGEDGAESWRGNWSA